MAPQQQEQLTEFVEGLFAIRPPTMVKNLSQRMAYQRWLLEEVAFFWPNLTMVDVVLEVVAPCMGRLCPRPVMS